MNRQKMISIGLGVVSAAVLFIAFSTQWRFQAVALKLRGELPTVTWHQIAYQFTGGDYRVTDVRHRGRLAWIAEEAGDGPCAVRWSTPLGSFWGERRDQWALELAVREQLIKRIYHNSSVAVAAGDVVIDVGGHLGTFTRFALDREASQVVVLEPEPLNIACLKRSFSAEIDRGQVILVEAAAWHEAGVLHFSGEGLTGHVDGQGTLEVQAVTLDDVVAELTLDRVDFIKMDIEGADLDALKGARRTIARFGPRMALSIYHRPDHPREIPRLALAEYPNYRVTKTREFAYFR